MANVFVQPARASFGTEMAAALTAKYGGNATIHYSDNDSVVFTCTAISNKVIRISKIQVYQSVSSYMDQLFASYGDAWTTGTTITNPVQFSGNSRTGANIGAVTAYITTADVVLGDTFLLIAFPTTRPQMCLIGILTNDKPLCIGWTEDNTYSNLCHGYFTDGTVGEVEMPSLSDVFSDDGYFVVFPVLFTINTRVQKKMDNSYATLNGIYNVAHGVRVASTTLYISRSRFWYTASLNAQLYTGLMCPIG